MDDKELVRRILNGDEAAKNLLYQNNARRLYTAACVFLGYQDSEAEDVVQETFVAAFKDLERFEFRASLYTWLNHICVNLCYKRLRERRRVVVGLDNAFEALTGSASIRRTRDEEQDDETARLGVFVWEQLKRLKEACRKIIKMRHEEGYAYAIIAEKMKIPLGTVMSRLARCRAELKKHVEKQLKKGGYV